LAPQLSHSDGWREDWRFFWQLWKRVARARREETIALQLVDCGLIVGYLALGVYAWQAPSPWSVRLLAAVAAWTWFLAPIFLVVARTFDFKFIKKSEFIKEIRLANISDKTLAQMLWLQSAFEVFITIFIGIMLICVSNIFYYTNMFSANFSDRLFNYEFMKLMIEKHCGWSPVLLLCLAFFNINSAEKLLNHDFNERTLLSHRLILVFFIFVYWNIYHASMPRLWDYLGYFF
jgi:hypothetical protein